MGVIEAIGAGPVGIDTVAFIYFIEEHPRYLPVVEPIFAAMASGRMRGVTSGVTLLEALVVPYRARDMTIAAQYELLLTRSKGLVLVELDRQLLRDAAQLRAVSSMRTPDALQVAAALRERCTVFITNDRDLRSVAGMEVVQLSDHGA